MSHLSTSIARPTVKCCGHSYCEVCIDRVVKYCGEIDSYENITEIHLQKCSSFLIACRQHCGENVQRQEIIMSAKIAC